ncbi:MAG TPA: carboxypeptidase regulatory-like domain-containing protein, partial [Gemmatimonadaceae bacterium]|nr:carboxypeptidase regulatory-like domain-containing protein [Gemmatimonadaceae bacterium]
MRSARVVFIVLALAVAPRPATTLLAQGAPATRISGSVFDSLAMRPLPAALVQLTAGTRVLSDTTDSLGRFVIDSAPGGEYLLGFLHPRLDSLALQPPLYRASLHGGEVHADLAIPSAATLIARSCGAQSPDDSLGILVGHILDADDRAPRADATISAAWLELELRRSGVFQAVRTASARADANGRFALCGVPQGTMLGVHLAMASDTSPLLELSMPASGYLSRDFFAGPQRAGADAMDSTLAAVQLTGAGTVRGRVVGSAGEPLTGARVRSTWSGVEVVADASGNFALTALPTGSQMLEARAIGFLSGVQLVDVLANEASRTTFELMAAPTDLDTVRVVATPIYLDQERREFDERRAMGLGQFFADAEITRRNPVWLTDIIRLVPGAQVVPTSRAGRTIVMRGGPALGSGFCKPDVWMDGARTEAGDMSFDSLLPINSIRA